MFTLIDFILYGALAGIGVFLMCAFGYFVIVKCRKALEKNKLQKTFTGIDEHLI